MKKLLNTLFAVLLTMILPVQAESTAGGTGLSGVLAAQPAEVRARYQYRHPQETLEFFGITPGMTVVEALPGRGWYTKILLAFLGSEGRVVGADYALDMWPRFGFLDDKALAAKQTWTTDWPAEADTWRDGNSAQLGAFNFSAMPEEVVGTADAVLFIRALHNLNRFEADGGFLTAALKDAYRALKPGGILGVVQHHGRDEMPDDWAGGVNGYLKKDFVIGRLQEAGFEFDGEIDVNANAADRPELQDFVWRLPPTLITSRDNPKLQAQFKTIGESNRMTLKFRKPD